MFCNNCGNKLPENAKFCNSCGAAVAAAAKKTCLNCGNELLEGAVFCNICGAKCGIAPTDMSMPTEEMEYCCKRGLECLNGDAFSAAKEHFTKAAEAGHAESQYQLACMFHSGIGSISKNEQAATKWYFKAAMQGHANAQYSLSRQYITGEGVERDFAAAARWLRLSAEQNCANALLFLGFLHDPIELNTIERKAGEENIIIPADVNKAREYYTKAMENGCQNAGLYYARLSAYINITGAIRNNDQNGMSYAAATFLKCLEPYLNSDMGSVSLYGVSPNFTKRLNGALSFASMTYGELPLMMIDSTIMGSGKSGLLLTSKALYFKEMLGKPIIFGLDGLPELTYGIDEKYELFDLRLNGTHLSITFREIQNVEILIFMVHFLANGFKFINKICDR